MEHSIDQHLMQVDPKQFVGQPLSIKFEEHYWAEIGDLGSFHVLQSYDLFARIIVDYGRDQEQFEVTQVHLEGTAILGLLPIVEFAENDLPQSLDNLNESDASAKL